MINFEGGAIPEEYLTAYVVDRVNTTGTVWLGLTVGCAQCHDHKYDPITQKEYYRLYAFFNNVPENGLDGSQGERRAAAQGCRRRAADASSTGSAAEIGRVEEEQKASPRRPEGRQGPARRRSAATLAAAEAPDPLDDGHAGDRPARATRSC